MTPLNKIDYSSRGKQVDSQMQFYTTPHGLK